MINIIPFNDEHEHEFGMDCWCQPEASFHDEETGEIYQHGPIITHNSADHRECPEVVTGEGMPSKKWGIFVD